MPIPRRELQSEAANLIRKMIEVLPDDDQDVTIVIRTGTKKVKAVIDRKTGNVSPVEQRDRGAARTMPR